MEGREVVAKVTPLKSPDSKGTDRRHRAPRPTHCAAGEAGMHDPMHLSFH